MESFKNIANNFINQHTNLTNDDKNLFYNIFLELAKEQQNTYDDLKNLIIKELAYTTKFTDKFEIFTALVDTEDIDKIINFTPIETISANFFKDGFLYSNIGFLNCSYGDKYNYIDKDFIATISFNNNEYEVKYKLHNTSILIQKEAEIIKCALQNNIKFPVIFAPMSRRAVEIVVDLTDISNFDDSQFSEDFIVDLKIELNGLTNVLLLDKTLVWNVVTSVPKARENTNVSLTLVGDKEYQYYEFEPFNEFKDNEFIYVKNENSDIRKLDNNLVYVGLDKDISINKLDCIKFEITDIKLTSYFSNTPESLSNPFFKMHENVNIKDRILTIADIEYVLNQFENIKHSDISFKLENSENIYTYCFEDKHQYPFDYKLRNSCNRCYIRFIPVENDIFFEDKISFIIDYFNYFYPEFYFVGVR